MADIHDQAMQWAQANPHDPRAQDIMAKAWAAKNPSDPRAAQIMAKFQAPSEPSLYDKAGSKVTGALEGVFGKDNVARMRPYADMATAAAGGVAKGVTLGNAEPSEDSIRQAMQEHPFASGVGNLAGSSVPVALGAGALGPATTGAGRIGVSGTVGGLEGLLRAPGPDESRLGNAYSGMKTGLALGAGGEAVAGLAGAGRKAATWMGSKLTGSSMRDAENYVNNPELAEELRAINKNSPMALSKRVKAEVGGGLDEAYDKVSEPALDRVGKAVAGKKVRVNTKDIADTAAGSEAQRAWNTQGNTVDLDVPVYEPHQVQATPVEPRMRIGEPQTQSLPHGSGYAYGKAPTAAVSAVDRSIVKAGEPQTLEDLLLPQGSQSVSVPTPVPETVTLEGPQALRAKRMSQKAAFANQANALNPQAYNAADDAEAIAAARFRKGLENVAPSTAADNDILEQAARYSAHAKSTLKNNPAAILTDSDSLGSVPMRSMREFLDKHGGTDLESMAKALSAGKAINEVPAHAGLLDRAVARPIGKAALKAASKFDGSFGRAMQSPILLNALIKARSE